MQAFVPWEIAWHLLPVALLWPNFLTPLYPAVGLICLEESGDSGSGERAHSTDGPVEICLGACLA